MVMRLDVVLWVLSIVVCSNVSGERLPGPTAASQPSAASQPIQPIVHLLAPTHEYAAKFDCLVPEAALRLAAIDLAARHGKYARFWPVD